MTIPSISMTSMMPSVSNISKDIISQTDTDSDSALSLEELGIDEELFNSIDTDSDGLATQSEIASAIESKLSEEYGDTMPTPEEFASLLSDLGLEMPEPPQKPEGEQSSINSDFAAELMSIYDTDGDSLLTAEEVSLLTSDEFSALDTDEDGTISTEELTAALDEVSSSSTTEASAPPPPPPGGMMGSDSSSEEEEETYSELDTNQDGYISAQEYAAAYGSEEEDSTSTTNIDTLNKNALNNIDMLMKALNSNSDTEVDQNSFSGILKMLNAQNNNSELNTYLSKTNTSSLFGYA